MLAGPNTAAANRAKSTSSRLQEPERLTLPNTVVPDEVGAY